MGEYEPNDSRNVTGAGNQQQQNAAGQGGQGQQQQGGQGSAQPLGHGQDAGWRSQAPTEAEARQQGGAGGQGGQPQQFQQPGGQMGGGAGAGGARVGGGLAEQLREHMEVIGADGTHLGTVDAIEGDRIKLTKADSGAGFEGGSHQGHHHFLPLALVAAVEGNRVRLSANAGTAYGMEEEE